MRSLDIKSNSIEQVISDLRNAMEKVRHEECNLEVPLGNYATCNITIGGDVMKMVCHGEEIKREIFSDDETIQDYTRMCYTMSDLLKKQYKEMTGKNITMNMIGGPDTVIEPISTYRVQVRSVCVFKVKQLSKQDSLNEGKSYKQKFLDSLMG